MLRSVGCFCILAVGVAASAAAGATVTATMTADNHYALYTGAENGSSLTLIGGNELGPGGAPGLYNWSIAESYAFLTESPFIYLAAWSDDNVAQGMLAEFTIDGGTLLSGDPAWTVFATGIDKDDGNPYPTLTEMTAQIVLADATAGWDPVSVDGYNGVAPWGTIGGISASARWMWGVPTRCPDPFHPGYDHDEYLIFRTAVPEPSSLALLAVGGIVTLRTVRRGRTR
ncbi:MAG: PEP-CTERM sorting domain-containing protein [Planctomycetota bacterium]